MNVNPEYFYDPFCCDAEPNYRSQTAEWAKQQLTAPKSIEKRAKRYHQAKEMHRRQRRKAMESYGVNYRTNI